MSQFDLAIVRTGDLYYSVTGYLQWEIRLSFSFCFLSPRNHNEWSGPSFSSQYAGAGDEYAYLRLYGSRKPVLIVPGMESPASTDSPTPIAQHRSWQTSSPVRFCSASVFNSHASARERQGAVSAGDCCLRRGRKDVPRNHRDGLHSTRCCGYQRLCKSG